MRKLLTLIAAMTMCNAYGEAVYWMVDNSLSSVSGCSTGDNITKPSNPTKTGYKFIGWKEGDTNSFIATYVGSNGTSHTPSNSGTNANTWTSTFSWGTVTGAWRCSTDSGTADWTNYVFSTNANPTLSGYGCGTDNSPTCPNKNVSGNNAGYCWCKMTNFAGKSVLSLAWVFSRDYGASLCATDCAMFCANRVRTILGFRRAVFGL